MDIPKDSSNAADEIWKVIEETGMPITSSPSPVMDEYIHDKTGFSAEEFRKRRQHLLDILPDDTGLVILETKPEIEMTPGNPYRYRPDTEFYYYTGFTEPNAFCCLAKNDVWVEQEKNWEYRYHLAVQPRDEAKEVWTGPRVGRVGACQMYGADMAFNSQAAGDVEIVLTMVRAAVLRGLKIYFLGRDSNSLISKGIESLTRAAPTHNVADTELNSIAILERGKNLLSPLPVIHCLRLAKSPAEQALLRTVCRKSSEAMARAIRMTRPGINEWVLDGHLYAGMVQTGCPRLAYPNIVGSGTRATILHYDQNNQRMNDGDMVLVDSGGEYRMMAADISRTWPVNGKFTEAQLDIYRLVLHAQESCIQMARPGVTFAQLQDCAARVLTEGLLRLGFFQAVDADNRTVDKLVEQKAYKPYYMHYIGHWLGLEVHDCTEYFGDDVRENIMFEPGFCFTIEPGLYLREDDQTVPEQYRGIGVRIEDDILLTEEGIEVLSAGVTKEPNELEKLVGSGSWTGKRGRRGHPNIRRGPAKPRSSGPSRKRPRTTTTPTTTNINGDNTSEEGGCCGICG